MSRRDNLVSVERRIRRLAVRRGWSLLKAERLNPKIRTHGGYMLRDDTTFEAVFGNKGYDFSATLEEIEAFLEGLEEGE